MQVINEGLRARVRDEQSRFAQANRAANLRQLRDVRDRMGSATGTRRSFDAELFATYARVRISSLVVVVTLALAVQVFSLLVVDLFSALGTLAVIGLTNLVAMANARALIAKFDEIDPHRAKSRAFVAELFCGLAWVPALMPFLHEGSVGSTVMMFVGLVVLAVACIVGAPVPATILMMGGPVIMTLLVKFSIAIDMENAIFLAMTLSGVGFFALLAKKQYISTIESLEARAEKDLLIAQLEEARVNSDDARRRAESANVAKSQFLAQMSHELRTPLNAILGFSEVLVNELYGPLNVPQYKEYATDIHTSGKHLLNLINEVLDISRIEAGRTELHEDAVMLTFIAEDCHHLLRVRAKNKGVDIVERFDESLTRLWADERAVRQIILNLVSNAIKFTPKGGEILITCGWTAGGGQFVSIKDNGPGIPEDEIPQVLSTFGQGTNAIKVAEQGTGLGLPIVKGLVELHGGTFVLNSKLREGTEVIATFPAERVMQALPAVSKAPTTAPQKPLNLPQKKETDFLAQSTGFNPALVARGPSGKFNVRDFIPTDGAKS